MSLKGIHEYFLKRRDVVVFASECALVVLGISKLALLSADQNDANKIMFDALRSNTTALGYLHDGSEKNNPEYLKAARKDIETASQAIVAYFGERVPACYFPEGTIPGSNVKFKDLTFSVRYLGPAGKLIDLELAKGISKIDGTPCNPAPLFVGLGDRLVRQARYGSLIEVLMALIGAALLYFKFVQFRLDAGFPARRKHENSIPRYLK
jgi:hypothetical protein